jgi:hypothetical protein
MFANITKRFEYSSFNQYTFRGDIRPFRISLPLYLAGKVEGILNH